jgi:hypothetical protein
MAESTVPGSDCEEALGREIEREVAGRSVLPLSCDLTGDRTACAILRQWARQPWESIHPAALLDRMEELGDCEQGKAQVRRLEQQVLSKGPEHHKRTRTTYHRFLKLWKAVLIDHFGDFESQKQLPYEQARGHCRILSAQLPAG